MSKKTKRPLKAPLAFFEASLSLDSRNEDDLEELTGNQSEENVEDEPEDSWNTQEFVEDSRRQNNFKMYKVSSTNENVHVKKYILQRLLPPQFFQWLLI